MEFLHPHISSTIVDNSGVVASSTTTTETGTILFAPFFSEKGRDNEMVTWTDPLAFIAEHGTPNMKKYGQSQYNIVRWLLSGGTARTIRLMPTDAAYANSFAVVELKIEDNKLVLKTLNESYADLTNEASIEAQLTKEYTAPEGVALTEGTIRKRLFAVVPTGRGEFGKAYKYSLKINTLYKDTYDFPVYDFEVFKTDEKGNEFSAEGPFLVALKPDALANDGSSLFIQNVLETYASTVKVIFNEKAYDEITEYVTTETIQYTVEEESVTGTIFDAVNATRTSNKITSPDEIDYIFGRDGNGNKFDCITSSSEVGVGIDLGFKLSGSTGSLDGSFATKNEDELAEARDNLLIAAFGGGGESNPTIDNRVFEVRNYPIDVVLDFGCSNEVKLAMQTFSDLRKDVFIYYDLPVSTGNVSAATCLTTKRNYTFTNKYDSALFGQTFVVADTYTSSDIKVTMSYFLATLIPVHDRIYGCHRPMAGAKRGILPEFKKLSFNPSENEKEDLYNDRINFIEQTTKGARINSQITMQEKATALSNINNVRTLFLIIRGIENVADEFEFEYADNDTIVNFQAAVDSELLQWHKACTTISGTVYQSEYDKAQKIARVRLDIVFKDIIERIAIEINVGR